MSNSPHTRPAVANELPPIWNLTQVSTAVLSTLGCALALPAAWRVHRRAEGICAAPAEYDAALPPPYEFHVRDAAAGLAHAMAAVAGIAELQSEPLRGPRLSAVAHASCHAANRPMNICVIGEYFDHRRRCALHVVREWAHAAVPPTTHAVRIWRHATIDDRGEAQHWINEAAGLHITVPRSWAIDVHEPRRLIARLPRRPRSRPSIVVAVADGPRRPRTIFDMVESCGCADEPWRPLRLGNRAALRRSTPFSPASDETQEFVHQIVPEPSAEAAVFVELVAADVDVGTFAAVAARRAWPGFRWLERL
jgi:hypothetical protein